MATLCIPYAYRSLIHDFALSVSRLNLVDPGHLLGDPWEESSELQLTGGLAPLWESGRWVGQVQVATKRERWSVVG